MKIMMVICSAMGLPYDQTKPTQADLADIQVNLSSYKITLTPDRATVAIQSGGTNPTQNLTGGIGEDQV